MKELFGQRLREQRIQHGLTLEQLAEKSELSSNYIGMVERGLKEPGLATIVKLLNALNISADTLLCDLVPSASHVTDDEIRKRLNLAVLFITHDLRVAAQICDYVAVMSQGRVVEYGAAEQVFEKPKHDYTKSLFAAAPGRHWEFGKFAAA